MKNLIKLFILTTALSLGACNSPERSVGFATGEGPNGTDLSQLQFHLGTQETVDIVTDLDKLWAAGDWEAMRPYFSDTFQYNKPDGTMLNSFDEFVESNTSGPEVTWTINNAFSVDLAPDMGGELVHANFTITYPETGVSHEQHEMYYIVQGQIMGIWQYKMDIIDQE